MTTTVAAFQPDAAEAPAFQLAAFGGFQTQAVELEAPPPSSGIGISGGRIPKFRGRRYRAACTWLLVVDLDVVAHTSTALSRDDDDVLAFVAAGGLGRVALVHDRDDEDVVLLVAAGAPKTGIVDTRFLPAPAAWLALLEEDERA